MRLVGSQNTRDRDTQTDSDTLKLTDKLKCLEDAYGERMKGGTTNYRVVEERMVKYKREWDIRMKEELRQEIDRIREVEVSNVRLQEAARYRVKVQEMR